MSSSLTQEIINADSLMIYMNSFTSLQAQLVSVSLWLHDLSAPLPGVLLETYMNIKVKKHVNIRWSKNDYLNKLNMKLKIGLYILLLRLITEGHYLW